VTIVADPNTDKNTHHIEASGKFGKMTFTIENFPDPTNPKTSRLATLSAVETLRKYCSNEIQIGT
jgi:aspartate dehydrogenase